MEEEHLTCLYQEYFPWLKDFPVFFPCILQRAYFQLAPATLLLGSCRLRYSLSLAAQHASSSQHGGKELLTMMFGIS